MAQSLASLLVHITFSTKNRIELITPELESGLFPYVSGITANHTSPCLAINGTADHLHLLVSLSKNLAASALIREVKKASTKWVNSSGLTRRRFEWQDGYFAFSIGQSNVEAVKRYIARQ